MQNFLPVTAITLTGLLAGAGVYLHDVDRTVDACTYRVQRLFMQQQFSEGDAASLGVSVAVSDMLVRPMVRARVVSSERPAWAIHLECLTQTDDELRRRHRPGP